VLEGVGRWVGWQLRLTDTAEADILGVVASCLGLDIRLVAGRQDIDRGRNRTWMTRASLGLSAKFELGG
jgi:hypothetical protein